MLRGEITETPQESKSKGKAQYRTAQDDLRDARLRAEAEAAVQDEVAEQPEADGAEARKEGGTAESSEEESDAGAQIFYLAQTRTVACIEAQQVLACSRQVHLILSKCI